LTESCPKYGDVPKSRLPERCNVTKSIEIALIGQEPGRADRYSRDKRSDCVQVVIALIVTPDGFPLAYEVMDGNTSDETTLKEFETISMQLRGSPRHGVRSWSVQHSPSPATANS